MKTLLLVEDDQFIRDLMSTKLVQAGYQVEVASTGEEAIEKSSGTYDAMLLDIKLPKKSGVEVLSELKDAGRIEQMPVIVFSNIDDPDVRSQCMELGARAFLVKYDTDLDNLVTEVNDVLA